MHRHTRLLTYKRILNPAYHFTVGTRCNAVKCFSAVLWLDCLQWGLFVSILSNSEPPSGVCQSGISISVHVLGKAWRHIAFRNCYVFDVTRPLNSFFFFKPFNWNYRQAFENLEKIWKVTVCVTTNWKISKVTFWVTSRKFRRLQTACLTAFHEVRST